MGAVYDVNKRVCAAHLRSEQEDRARYLRLFGNQVEMGELDF